MRKILLVSLTLCAIANFAKAQLSGTYTIDPSKVASATNYKSFTSAVADLDSGVRHDGGTANGQGVSGAVVFKVASDTFVEQFIITAVNGASATNTITFTSETSDSSKTTIKGGLELYGSSWIRISEIGLLTASSSQSTIIMIDHGSSNNILSHCMLQGNLNNGNIVFESSSQGMDSSNVYENNYLINGNNAFYLVGSSKYESGTIVQNNIISGFENYGIYVQNLFAPEIIFNELTSNTSVTAQYAACIFIDNNCTGPTKILQNKMIMTNGGYPLYSNNLLGSASAYVLIANNFILSNDKINSYINTGSYFKFYNNNVYGNTAGGYAYFLNISNAYIYNNNFVSDHGSTSADVETHNSDNSTVFSDHNNYYTNHDFILAAHVEWNGKIYTYVADLFNAIGEDSSSVEINAKFVSSTDLHATNTTLAGLGKSLPEITTDIDGKIRNKYNPTIGANEISFKNDAGIINISKPIGCGANQNISISLVNGGTDTLHSDSISWTINGVAQTHYFFSGKLAPDSVIVIVLGTYNFQTGITSVKAWTSHPNGVTDSFTTNDTLTLIDTVYAPSASYSVTVGKCGEVSFSANPATQNKVAISDYVWSGAGPKGYDSLRISGKTALYQYTSGGEYYYSLKVNGSNGCSTEYKDSLSITKYPGIMLPGDTAICANTSIMINSTLVNAIQPYKISWSLTDSMGDPLTSQSVNESFTRDTSIRVIIQDQGCTNYDSMKIKVNPAPSPSTGSNHSICSGSSISLGGSAVSGQTYSWTSSPAGFSSSISDPKVAPLKNTTYYLTETITSTGCSASDSVIITLNPNPVSEFSYTNVCLGDSTPFINNSTSASSFKWYFGDGSNSNSSNPKHLYASIGSYVVSLKVASDSGCVDSSAKTVSLSSCVWPGDANNDKTVDMNDLLNIGIAYGTIGHPRPSANISWTAQPSPDWDSSFSNGVNYKFADCNGDSIINYADTVAISTNYGKSHSKTSAVEQGSPSDPPFTINSMSDTIYAGDTMKATFNIGNNTIPVQNLYGILFSLSADPAYFEMDHASIKINSSFLGTDGTNLIGMKIYNASNGLIDMGFTRIDHKNASGYGSFATLYLPVKATLPQKEYKTALGISGNNQISYNGKNVSLYFSSDSVVVLQDTSGFQNTISQPLPKLNIYPNPFNATTTIQYTLTQKSNINIALYDVTGRQVASITNKSEVAGVYQVTINAEKYHLSPGVYLLKLMTNNNYVSQHIVKL